MPPSDILPGSAIQTDHATPAAAGHPYDPASQDGLVLHVRMAVVTVQAATFVLARVLHTVVDVVVVGTATIVAV